MENKNKVLPFLKIYKTWSFFLDKLSIIPIKRLWKHKTFEWPTSQTLFIIILISIVFGLKDKVKYSKRCMQFLWHMVFVSNYRWNKGQTFYLYNINSLHYSLNSELCFFLNIRWNVISFWLMMLQKYIDRSFKN